MLCTFFFLLPSFGFVQAALNCEIYCYWVFCFHDWAGGSVSPVLKVSLVTRMFPNTLNQLGSIRREGEQRTSHKAEQHSWDAAFARVFDASRRKVFYSSPSASQVLFYSIIANFTQGAKLQRQCSSTSLFWLLLFRAAALRLVFSPSTLFLSSSSSREVNGAMIKLFCIHFGALVLLPLEDFNCTSQFAAFVAITCNYRGAVTIWRFEAGNCNGRSRRNGEICAICIDVINESNLKLWKMSLTVIESR